jgi:CRISPR system Cascade subunit CasB
LGVDAPAAEERAYFLVASLYAWYNPQPGEKGKSSHSFGNSFADLITNDNEGSMEKRFSALLACRSEDLYVHLRHAVGLLKTKSIDIDWAQLLRDVKSWDQRNHRVQRHWAKDFWARKVIENQETDGE